MNIWLEYEKEKKKLVKFMPSLALSTLEELNDLLKLLEQNGILITKASQIKVTLNTTPNLFIINK